MKAMAAFQQASKAAKDASASMSAILSEEPEPLPPESEHDVTVVDVSPELGAVVDSASANAGIRVCSGGGPCSLRQKLWQDRVNAESVRGGDALVMASTRKRSIVKQGGDRALVPVDPYVSPSHGEGAVP